ncbi:MAG TPA: cytochrome c3 family protein [Blastocatellia bacterium]|nr:cytochrome c3 family protein [Blastocatellia bacterium]
MSQIFHRSTNVISRVTIFGAIFFIGLALWLMAQFTRSSYNTFAFVPREQPVQFSHKHHVGDDGIDCRYCHTTVETSAFAGIPPTKTCMNCHSQLWSNSTYLEPVRESWRTGKPIEWTRVHDLPDFVYFDHSIHVNKGVGCSTCHGRVDLMPLTWQVESLQMEWCLECHREPQKFIRPKKEVFTMDWPPETWKQDEEGAKLLTENKIQSTTVLTSCSTCHR